MKINLLYIGNLFSEKKNLMLQFSNVAAKLNKTILNILFFLKIYVFTCTKVSIAQRGRDKDGTEAEARSQEPGSTGFPT